MYFNRIWSGHGEGNYVEEYFQLKTSSLVPGKPKVDRTYGQGYGIYPKNGVMDESIEWKWTRKYWVWFNLPSNVVKKDVNTFVSLLYLRITFVSFS